MTSGWAAAHYKNLVTAVALTAAIAAPTRAQRPVANHPRVLEAVRLLDAWMDAEQAYERIPGMSIAVVFDQELLWAKGYGYADVDRAVPATPGTIYSACSIAKLFTATAVMQLRDRGRLRLDDPVERHLDWFRIALPFADAGPITIEGLLTHSAGLVRDLPISYWTGPDYPFPSREAIIASLSPNWVRYPPATRYEYSNLGMTLAGEIVSQLSGMSYDTYVRTRIFEPLGMTSTFTDQPESLVRGRLATGYTLMPRDGARKVVPPYQVRGLAPVAGLVSTVEDLARFASWQFRVLEGTDDRVLDRNSLRAMHQVQWMGADSWTTAGYGYQIWRENDRTFLGHAGTCPGYQSQLLLRPQENVAAVVMINSQGVSPNRYTQRAYDILAPAVRAARNDPTPAGVADASAASLQRFTGLYRRPLGSESVVLTWQGRLAILGLPTQNPLSSMETFEPAGAGVFRRSGPRPELAEVVEFKADDRGQMRLWRGHQYWVRAR